MTDWIELAIILVAALLGLWVAFLILCMVVVALYDALTRPRHWRRWGR
jgi:hypothetical protein